MEDIQKRLGRLKQFDERSRSFNVAEVLPEKKKPRSYTWSIPQGSMLNQGNFPACVGFSWAHELIARPARVQGINFENAFALYKRAQDLDIWEGNQYEGTSVLAGAKAVKESGKIGEYRWAFNFDDALLAIGYAGPVVIGINWYEGMSDVDANGFIHPTGSILGGHAIMVNRVSMKEKIVEMPNTWGLKWGVEGRCKLSFDDFGRLLSEQGECVVPLARTL